MKRNKLIIVATLVVSLVFGTAAGIAYNSMHASAYNKSIYKVNENGQTYGSDLYATSASGEPDLVAATGTNGKDGYVYAKDLRGKMPSNPKEAIALMESESYKKDRAIPLYMSDGKTVIGEFVITGTDNEQAVTITQEEKQNGLTLQEKVARQNSKNTSK